MVNPGKKKQELDVWDIENERWDLRKIADKIEKEKSFKYISDDDTDQLFVYESGIWKEKGESVIRRKSMEYTNELLRRKNIGQVETIIKTRNEIYIDEEGFETSDYLVPFRNGVYDVKQEEFREFRETDNLTFKHDIHYVEDEDKYQKMMRVDIDDYKGKVEEFLWTLQDTERKVQILKESAGLALLSNFPIDEAPILYGKGSNGKNMFVELIKQMAGPWHSINLDEMTDDKFAKKELENSTFVFFDELGNVKNPNKVKQLIGNEEMRVRPMRDTGYMAKQRAFPVLAANEVPKAPEQNDGFFRRFQIVEFPYQFTSQKNDGNKDKEPREKVIQEYMNEHALDLFATKIVQQLPEVVEKEGFTESLPTDVTRQKWNTKSKPVYSFLDIFVEQGDLPNQGSIKNADKINKNLLLNIANEYIKAVNGTEIRQHKLSNAIDNNPDLKKGKDGRIETVDGRRIRAYTGLKLTLPDTHDAQGQPSLLESRNLISLKYWQHFDDASSYQAAQGLVIAGSDEIAKTIKYLEFIDEDKVNLLEVVRELSFSKNQVEDLFESELINIDQKEGLKSKVPDVEIDRKAFDKAIKESDKVIQQDKDYIRPSRFIQDRIQDMTQNQEVQIENYFIDPGKDKGFSEEKLEEAVDDAKGNELAQTPTPGKVRLM